MNNLYEFGGVCDVIIKCHSARKIGNKNYSEGEPYTILKDVYVTLAYKNTTNSIEAKSNNLAYRKGLPDIVNINGVTLTDKICDLIATRCNNSIVTKAYEAISDSTRIYLPEKYITGSIFVYHNNERFLDFTEAEDSLFGQFIVGEKYLIFYSTKINNSCFEFETPSYGYFTLDIVGKGNLNKKTKDVYLNFPAVSLMSVPVFDMVNGNLLNSPLQFECIHRGQKAATFAVSN